MSQPSLRRRTLRIVLPILVLSATLAACSGDGPVEPDPAVQPFVGEWDGIRMVVTNKANPDQNPDLIGDGLAEFFVDIQPSSQYTAQLTVLGRRNTEFGRVEVRGDQLILHRESPAPPSTTTATYRLSADGDSLFLDGDTEFDFNLDGQPEPARAEIDLLRR